MSLAQYAILDTTKTQVIGFDTIDSTIFATLPLTKTQFYRICNMIAQPVINPATQAVVQNGWTITASDVQPVWLTITLTASQQQSVAAATNWNSTLALNLVTAFNAYIATAVPTAAQQTAVIVQLVKCVNALLQAQYGVFN